MDAPTNFYDFTRAELETWFEERGHPRYRARQLFLNVS
jgi:adenine C2-methylase RlmN of 23S rRNA A2503 and tRNA A37